VYLRSTLSKGRAEILQLESLENIASCLAPGTPSRAVTRKRLKGSSAKRLDLFRAVSFARQLATQLAEQVTQMDPLGDAASAASNLPHFFKPESSKDGKHDGSAILRGRGGRGQRRDARGHGGSSLHSSEQ
jgi:hypothetical protein